MARRVGGSMNGDGASSMIFWCRRWMEHSLSPRYTAVPWRSASTWISMWRGSSMKRSMNRRSSPKLERASLPARSKPSRHSASLRAMRIPLPPPPALALSITG